MQIRELIESFEGPQPADVRLMKRKTGESSYPVFDITFLFPSPKEYPELSPNCKHVQSIKKKKFAMAKECGFLEDFR